MSMLIYPSDEFTSLIAELKVQAIEQREAIDKLQAEIDSLMAEYCMDKMSVKQIVRWNKATRKEAN